MKYTASMRAVRNATGVAFTAVLLASPLYADGNDHRPLNTTTKDATSTMECQHYSGAERTDCERRASQNRLSEERMEEGQDLDSAAAPQRDTSRTSTRSDRTRVSRADTERTTEESDSRDSDPADTQGADMQNAPDPNYDRADDDVHDPYDAGPATETGSDPGTSTRGEGLN